MSSMDPEPLPELEVGGYRIAPMGPFDPDVAEGDADLVRPDGRRVELSWEAQVEVPYCARFPSTEPDALGWWRVGVTEPIATESDLRLVLGAVVEAIETDAQARPRCPACRGRNTIPIVYGLPDHGAMERAQRGEIALGGCIVSEEQPTDECLRCGNELRAGDPDLPGPSRWSTADDRWHYPTDPEHWTAADDAAWEREDAQEAADQELLEEVVARAKANGEDVTDAILDAFDPDR